MAREKMTNVDTAWWHMEDSTNLMMITSVMIFQGRLDYPAFRELVKKRLLKFDRFSQRIVEPTGPLGSAYWETDPHFNLDAHIHFVGLPAPGDKAVLENYVGDLMGIPLDYSKPLWQMQIIENYADGFVVITRLHHCIADGIALMRLLLTLMDESPDAVLVDDEKPPKPRRPGLLRRVTRPAVSTIRTSTRITGTAVRETAATIRHPGRLIDAARVGTDFALRLGLVTLRWPDPSTIFKGDLGIIKRAAWSDPLSLADVKAIGQVTGTTVNDVLVAAVTGALRRYMNARGQESAGLNIRAYIPVNLRPLDEPLELGNMFGLVFLSLPIGIADPLERLREVKLRMDELKNSQEAMVAITLLTVAGMLPKDIENTVFRLYHAKATAVLTNVPGPQKTLYMAGGRLRHMMGWVPQSGKLGLGISILSYDGEVLVGMNTDAGLVADPAAILGYFQSEFAELMTLVYNLHEEEE